ncbi:Ger(x)C family spore germination protein [Propionispora hippei]|uniref:Spore germination B3/ GerAC like, C-terminal n=1 Tax=Propionispora hippei DSM 15287 TaxID=1123003 RepID=A0A1M6IYR0_9FIRM|nr:Ger(x)C family spore germination protein [Propionispora hippei]SHJ39563.1 Spore germination B3/ GerAC like, C-terminal [Propionispora hippei DSM 15287]
MSFRLVAWYLLIVGSLFFATGCSGAQETDSTAYVLALGIDKGEQDGMIKYTCQVALPKPSTKEGGEEESKTQVSVTATARSLAEARNLINSSMSRTLTFSHMKALIIGEDLAKEGVNDIFAPLMRFRDMRGSIYILVANGVSAADFMDKNKPKLESFMSRYYESMMFSSNESGYYFRTTLQDFYKELKNVGDCPLATLVSLNGKKKGEDGEGSMFPSEVSPEYTAGNSPLEKGNPAEAMGLAVFSGDKMVGTLTNEEARMLNILRGTFKHGFYVITDPLVPEKFVNLTMRLNGKPHIKIEQMDGQIHIKVEVNVETEITAIPSGTNYEQGEYNQLLENHISQLLQAQILKMLHKTQEWGCDAVGFGVHMRPFFATHQEFMQLDWPPMYRQAEFDISVNTIVRRTGLMQQTVGKIE